MNGDHPQKPAVASAAGVGVLSGNRSQELTVAVTASNLGGAHAPPPPPHAPPKSCLWGKVLWPGTMETGPLIEVMILANFREIVLNEERLVSCLIVI